jgi:hypothetical protein
VCRETGAEVVLSSTWRLYPELMADAARMLNLPIIDRTPDHGSYDTRATEVQAWLDAHPEVEHFAIVDGVPVFDAIPELQAKFVQTDPAMGVTLATYRSLMFALATDRTFF